MTDAAIKTTIEFLVNASNFANSNLDNIEPFFLNAAVHFVLLTSQGITEWHEYTVHVNMKIYEYLMYNVPVLHASDTHRSHPSRSKSFPKNGNKPEIGGDSSFPE